jgi:hypothetical protein
VASHKAFLRFTPVFHLLQICNQRKTTENFNASARVKVLMQSIVQKNDSEKRNSPVAAGLFDDRNVSIGSLGRFTCRASRSGG